MPASFEPGSALVFESRRSGAGRCRGANLSVKAMVPLQPLLNTETRENEPESTLKTFLLCIRMQKKAYGR